MPVSLNIRLKLVRDNTQRRGPSLLIILSVYSKCEQ